MRHLKGAIERKLQQPVTHSAATIETSSLSRLLLGDELDMCVLAPKKPPNVCLYS